MALNDFYIFIYEAPHLLLIAEIKTGFFRFSLPEIFRHILFAHWLQVKKSQALNAGSTSTPIESIVNCETTPHQALCAVNIHFSQKQIEYKLQRRECSGKYTVFECGGSLFEL